MEIGNLGGFTVKSVGPFTRALLHYFIDVLLRFSTLVCGLLRSARFTRLVFRIFSGAYFHNKSMMAEGHLAFIVEISD